MEKFSLFSYRWKKAIKWQLPHSLRRLKIYTSYQTVFFPYLWIAVNHVFQRTSTNQCFPSSRYVSLKYCFSFWEMAKTLNTCRIHKVNDVIGWGIPEDSAFWDILVPPVVETWLWLDVGRWESQPERISPNIDVFLLWLSPTEERETSPTIRHPGEKQRVRPTMHLRCIS